ncbi:unnamed protein product [Sphagnum tenellum]
MNALSLLQPAGTFGLANLIPGYSNNSYTNQGMMNGTNTSSNIIPTPYGNVVMNDISNIANPWNTEPNAGAAVSPALQEFSKQLGDHSLVNTTNTTSGADYVNLGPSNLSNLFNVTPSSLDAESDQFFDANEEPSPLESAATEAIDHVTDVGAAGVSETIEKVDDLVQELQATTEPTPSEVLAVKTAVDKETTAIEGSGEPSAINHVQEQVDTIRVKAVEAVLSPQFLQNVTSPQYVPRITSQIKNSLQTTGEVNTTSLSLVTQFANDLELVSIVQPQCQYVAATTFWLKELMKSLLNKGGDHIKSLMQFISTYCTPAWNYASGILANVQQSAETLYNSYMQGTPLATDVGFYNAEAAKQFLNQFTTGMEVYTPPTGNFFEWFTKTSAKEGVRWAQEQFAKGTDWSKAQYVANQTAFDFAARTGILGSIFLSTFFTTKYLMGKFNIPSARQILYARFKKNSTTGRPEVQVVLDDGTGQTQEIENVDTLLRTAADEGAISFASEPPLQKGEEKAAILSITDASVAQEVLADKSEGTQVIVSEMIENPEMANRVIEKWTLSPNDTVIHLKWGNKKVAVPVAEVKEAVTEIVNINVAQQVQDADPAVVDAALQNVSSQTAEVVTSLINNGSVEDVKDALDKPETNKTDTEVKKALQEIGTNHVIPVLAEKKDEKNEIINSSVPPPPPPPPPMPKMQVAKVIAQASSAPPPPPPPPQKSSPAIFTQQSYESPRRYNTRAAARKSASYGRKRYSRSQRERLLVENKLHTTVVDLLVPKRDLLRQRRESHPLVVNHLLHIADTKPAAE